jgi:hypothetical protein
VRSHVDATAWAEVIMQVCARWCSVAAAMPRASVSADVQGRRPAPPACPSRYTAQMSCGAAAAGALGAWSAFFSDFGPVDKSFHALESARHWWLALYGGLRIKRCGRSCTLVTTQGATSSIIVLCSRQSGTCTQLCVCAMQLLGATCHCLSCCVPSDGLLRMVAHISHEDCCQGQCVAAGATPCWHVAQQAWRLGDVAAHLLRRQLPQIAAAARVHARAR